MKKLYALSFRGKMVYFLGDVGEEWYDQIEQIGNAIDRTMTLEAFCVVFSQKVLSELNIELIKCPVTHIFRIR